MKQPQIISMLRMIAVWLLIIWFGLGVLVLAIWLLALLTDNNLQPEQMSEFRQTGVPGLIFHTLGLMFSLWLKRRWLSPNSEQG